MRPKAIVLALALVGALAAQAPAQEQVTLRLKFTQNQVFNYRFYADMDGQMQMNLPMAQGQGAAAAQQPMAAKFVVQGTGRGKVLATDATGAARLRIQPDRLTMTIKMMGHTMKMEMAGGKMRTWQDGTEVTGEQPMPMMPGGQKMPGFDQPIEVKVSPRGQVLDMKMPGLEQMMQGAPQMMPGMDIATMLKQYPQVLLPEEPVSVGQRWDQTVSVPFTPQVKVPASYSAVLNDIEVADGQQVAVLGVASSVSAPNIDLGAMMKQAAASAAAGQPAPPMPDVQGAMGIVSKVTGTLRFNATGGFVQRFDGRLEMRTAMQMVMQAPPQAQQSGAPASMNIGMRLDVAGKFALARL